MSPSPAKRQRTEDDAPITRSDHWYKDGSVVLQAENVQFRVHWSLLSKHSSFFRDLEGLPQPPNQPTIDGCFIVYLHDSAVDVQYLLDAIYDPYFLAQTTLTLGAVGAMIRLGRKYDFKSFFDSAVERFTSQAPATLEEYDALLVNGTYPTPQDSGMSSTLPVAYLHAAQLDIASIVAEFSTDLDTLKRCLIGRETLLTKQFQSGYPLGWLRIQRRCVDLECLAFRQIEFRDYVDEKRVNVLDLHKFNSARWGDSLCENCHKHALESNAAGWRKMWEELPEMFDLPEWDQLTNGV
ncbi:BTB domain-containing protein [Mycena sanguinolenta]|uniref:BTB domain-containing protein n=1 Tax=Mycena sanguinolenta TaxID=230812 RepID=A0A8H6XZC5_9AGAR|nr:BTB domain-containing protein [Mycena sanguinolenta]